MSDPLAWTIEVPLLSTPVIVRQLAAVVLIPLGILTLLLVGLAWIEGSLDDLGAILRAMVGVLAILAVLMLVAILLFFNNRMTVSFEFTEDGVRSRVVDQRARVGRTMAIVLGVLARSPAAAGAGLLAQSNSSRFTRWHAIQKLEADPKRHCILLKGKALTLDAIFCSEDNFPIVKTRLEEKLKAASKRKVATVQDSRTSG